MIGLRRLFSRKKYNSMTFSASIKQIDEIISKVENETKSDKVDKKVKKVEILEEEHIVAFKKAFMQVSKIVAAEKHPNADSLMKCKVEIAPGVFKPLVAGILKAYSPGDVLDKLIVTILNLKPVTLKGEQSEVMLFASTEILSKEQKLLVPPEGSVIGDRVFLEGFSEGTPLDRIPPKQWEKVVSGFTVKSNLPLYNGIPLITKAGNVTVPTSDGSEFH